MPNRTYRVLHIDDDPALARLVERALTRRGYAYEHAGDAQSGMDRIAMGGVDVVVLDHFLDAGTGIGVLAELQAAPSPPPVVYVTGSQEPTVAVEALKAGAADYVLKTVGEDFIVLLTSAIEQSIEKARLERQKELAEQEVRAARDRAEILLTEVNHRVANSLALVAALVRMQASAVTDPKAKDALNETQARISAIAGLHRRLYTSDDVRSVSLDSYLSTLVEELDTAMKAAGHQSRVRLDLAPLTIPTDRAISIGMIVTELLTNAYKYAYPDNAAGEVRIVIRKASENRATLLVEDDGVGWDGTGKAKGTGLGTRIVSAMASQLGTTISYGDGRGGTRMSLELTLDG
ncbi:histidine kinase dimerization/phosphoacceptor domain -containing protein [Mesorhizobium sp. CAU 1732]|uniref:sensor histidine kinase n=1 Tax=Mesorhizobium sp. CAU 1732 TaxID=3140358 RepID=UPI003260D1A0